MLKNYIHEKLLSFDSVRLRNRLRDRIDWSSKNVVAHAINGKLALFEANQPQLITTHDIEILNSEKICALKWNNAGRSQFINHVSYDIDSMHNLDY